MTTAEVVETTVTGNKTSIQDYVHPDYHAQSTYEMTPAAGPSCRGRSRGRVQGVRTPPPRDDLRFSNTTDILPKKKLNYYVVYWC